jgi:carbonic anhydrase
MKMEKYFLLQVHQHAPAEHTIDGKVCIHIPGAEARVV